MAIARGQQSQEAAPRKLYMGIGAVKVLAVNPNKAELEKLYNREIEKEPEYLTEVEVEGKKYASARITFVVQTVADKNNGIDTIQQHTFFLRKQYRANGDKTKYQVIDKYGRTAWVTSEEYKAKAIPQYANGPANIDADYRAAFVGEEDLTSFIKNYLNIPNVQVYVNSQWVDNTQVAKEDCLMRLDDVEKYFAGNFSELKEIISYQPENLVKIAFGVKHADDGRVRQTTYTGMSFKNVVTNYVKLDAEIQSRKAQGGLLNQEFSINDLEEYVVTPTDTNALAAAAEASTVAEAADPWS